MSKVLCQITAQYYENYGASIHGVSHAAWKPKGGAIFSLMVDLDYFMYGEAESIEAINELLRERSNARAKFEYRAHEIIFDKIIELDADKFEDVYAKIVDKKHTLTKN